MTLPTTNPPDPASLLSHLTSRPSVLSTLILSRKNGSIIRCTGQLASSTPDPPSDVTATSLPAEHSSATDAKPAPTAAEKLARRVFDYVACASALASDVHSIDSEDTLDSSTDLSRRLAASKLSGESDGITDTEEADGGREEQEVKLLRLRTKGREIVVVVEKEWLLVVVNGNEKGKGAGGMV